MRLAHLIEDAGSCGGGRYAIHRDVEVCQFLAQQFCRSDDASFRGGIGRSIRVALLARYRSDIDNPAIALHPHLRHHRAVDVEGAQEIDLDDPAELLHIIVSQRRVGPGDPGGIDQDVNPVRCGQCCGQRLGNALPILDTRADRRATEGFRRFRGKVEVKVPQDNARTTERQPFGLRLADSLGTTGDDGGLAFEAGCELFNFVPRLGRPP